MATYFDVDVYAFRCNLYRDGSDWKPYHRDSHAYGGDGAREDFTMGASFGAERTLSFRHEETGTEFAFPQRQGDVFAFDSVANSDFTHGVPRAAAGDAPPGLRFSIIAWGRRRRVHARNGGTAVPDDLAPCVPTPLAYADELASRMPAAAAEAAPPESEAASQENELVLPAGEVASLIRSSGALTALADARDRRPPPRVRPRRHGGARGGTAAPTTGGRVPRAVRDRVGPAAFGALRDASVRYQRGAVSCGAYVTEALALVDLATLQEVVACLPAAGKRAEVAALLR